MGLAYKPNVDDMRESPTFTIMATLEDLGAEVDFYDPHINEIAPTREHSEYTGKRSIEWNESTIRSYDAVIIVTDHKAVDYASLQKWSTLIVDSRNVYPQGGENVVKS
jgi:UDP-N-acetyl-D-glucosamine dehydrogenase